MSAISILGRDLTSARFSRHTTSMASPANLMMLRSWQAAGKQTHNAGSGHAHARSRLLSAEVDDDFNQLGEVARNVLVEHFGAIDAVILDQLFGQLGEARNIHKGNSSCAQWARDTLSHTTQQAQAAPGNRSISATLKEVGSFTKRSRTMKGMYLEKSMSNHDFSFIKSSCATAEVAAEFSSAQCA